LHDIYIEENSKRARLPDGQAFAIFVLKRTLPVGSFFFGFLCLFIPRERSEARDLFVGKK
jgi:hypothetical protein